MTCEFFFFFFFSFVLLNRLIAPNGFQRLPEPSEGISDGLDKMAAYFKIPADAVQLGLFLLNVLQLWRPT